MYKKIVIEYLSDGSQHSEHMELPSLCPCCGIAVQPTILSGIVIDNEDEELNIAYLLNICPSCNECFMSKHIFDNDDFEGYLFISSVPTPHSDQSFSKSLSAMSPDFVKIYNESLYAEDLGLVLICGMGYRKALEFLVKDYIIFKKPELRDIVSSKMLSACIKDHISDERLKTLAKASTWIGNDETHYIKKHEHLNYKNLKIFINAFVTFVDAELAYNEAAKLTSSK